jgi:hypothetical protein
LNAVADQSYYFPALFLRPEFEADVNFPPFKVIRRRWGTSTFDLATLATKHKLHLPYQAMDIFLSSCSLEFCIQEENDPEAAAERFDGLRLSLYASGVSPFICPFITNYSVNDYSGINSRDSEILREKLPEEQRQGLTSNSGTVEAWPLQMSFSCITNRDALVLTSELIETAVAKTKIWCELSNRDPLLKVIADAANAAPMLLSFDQSILHIWAGLEALFPKVTAELAFKLALYLAQLAGTERNRLTYFNKVKKAYTVRSNVTHGTKRGISFAEWNESWLILMDSINAIIDRGGMPSEDLLLAGVLGGSQ